MFENRECDLSEGRQRKVSTRFCALGNVFNIRNFYIIERVKGYFNKVNIPDARIASSEKALMDLGS